MGGSSTQGPHSEGTLLLDTSFHHAFAGMFEHYVETMHSIYMLNDAYKFELFIHVCLCARQLVRNRPKNEKPTNILVSNRRLHNDAER